jgi:transposase
VDDRLWQRLDPLLADPPRRAQNSGRKRLPARSCLEGILYLLYTGGRYIDLPRELGFPSGETCRRRLQEWIKPGAWAEAMTTLIAELDRDGKLDLSRLVIDASIIDAKRGAISPAQAL